MYDLKGDALSMTARGFVGAKTLWRYEGKAEEEVTLAYSLAVDGAGQAKLVSSRQVKCLGTVAAAMVLLFV